MASIAIPKRPPWDAIPGVPTVGRGIGRAREYPIFPLVVLMILLIVPAITADWLAPHDHRVGDLDNVLLPPGWVGETQEVKTVVEKVSDNKTEIILKSGQRNVSREISTIAGRPGDTEVQLGDELARTKQGGSWAYPLGTDKQGRDILSRLMHGARVSLLVSSLAIFLGGGLGTALGLVAAYRGGFIDSLIMRIVDIKLAFPSILLALVAGVTVSFIRRQLSRWRSARVGKPAMY